MMHPLCFFRAIWRTIRCRAVVSGHDLTICDPEPGQACCVTNFRCMVCNTYVTTWETCRCRRTHAIDAAQKEGM